jgi:hypothetical protein
MFQVSRYEFEKMRYYELTEKQLEEELTARGSNYAAVRHHHNIHKVGGEGMEKYDDDSVLYFRHWRFQLPSVWRKLG